MAGERHGVAIWPGVVAVAECTYTISHGISPGCAILTTLPQASAPAEVGTLVITDGAETITLKDCKLDTLRVVQQGEDGFVWQLSIFDRRWKWKDLGEIAGSYNQLNPRAKLIPYTIRSPRELAILCLQAMGERRYVIDLPDGTNRIPNAQLGDVDLGQNQDTGTNPPVNWDWEVPAIALQNLAEQYGRRVVWRWSDDTVLIVRQGYGSDLPGGSIHSRSPSLDSPETPTGVKVIGAPTRFQCRLGLIAVGEEWDGTYKPINRLSYAPIPDGRRQKVRVTIRNVQPTDHFQIRLNSADKDNPQMGQAVDYIAALDGAIDVANQMVSQINASDSPQIKGVVTAAAANGNAAQATFEITGNPGQNWTYFAEINPPPGLGSIITVELVEAGVAGGERSWDYSHPPLFPDVRATDRLTKEEARRLAQKSVFKVFRLADVHPRGNGDIEIPGYGTLTRRQQIVLNDTQCEQVTPQPLDNNIVLPGPVGNPGALQPEVINFYNGWSRDKPAAVYGSVSINLMREHGRLLYADLGDGGDGRNTQRNRQLFFDFQIDPVWQLVIFNTHVYRSGDQGQFLAPSLILQTSVLIRNAETNALECFSKGNLLPNRKGNTNFATRRYTDCQAELIGSYNENNDINRVRLLDEDCTTRADYYLAGMAAQYFLAGGLTNEYNGIRAIDLDGRITQVTWTVGGSGASTVASANTEHNVNVPPYRARQRAERLPAAQAAAGRPAAPARINVGPDLMGGLAPGGAP